MIVRWNPWTELNRLQREMNDLFENRMRGTADDGEVETGWRPLVDIYEDADHFLLTVELPGLTAKDVEIKVEEQRLTLRGERKLEFEEKKDNYHRVERTYGKFVRTFTLPNSVDAEHIEANYKEGLLAISIPKKAEVKPKQITVKVGG